MEFFRVWIGFWVGGRLMEGIGVRGDFGVFGGERVLFKQRILGIFN